MGGTTSKIYGKLSRSWTSASCSAENLENTTEICRSPSSVGPFVFTRRGSQFFDEDGDLAHEFYEEVADELLGQEEGDDDDDDDDDEEEDDATTAPSPTSSSSSSSFPSGVGGVRRRRSRWRMRRKFRNLSPQGIVKLQFPRLRGDLPVVLCHVSPSQ